MSQHVSSVCRSVNYHICKIGKISNYVETCQAAARALVLSRLDYYNSLLNCITQQDLIRLQKLQNNAARLLHLKPKHIHPHFLISSIGSRYIKGLFIHKTALSCSKRFLIFLHIKYLSKSLDLSEPKRKGLHSQHNLNIPRTFKNKLAIMLFPLLDHVYGTVFLFRSGTLNQLISLKSNLKPICIHYRCCFIMSSCCHVFLYAKFDFVYLVPCAL